MSPYTGPEDAAHMWGVGQQHGPASHPVDALAIKPTERGAAAIGRASCRLLPLSFWQSVRTRRGLHATLSLEAT